MRKLGKTVKAELLEIKNKAVSLYYNELLFDFEAEVVEELCELVDDLIMCRINDKYFSVQEIVCARFMEYIIILETSCNRKVLELVELLRTGLSWRKRRKKC